MLYIQIAVRHLCLASTAQFATDMADAENVEEMVGTREAEAAVVATESGGTVATEFGGAATTGDETVATAGDETAALLKRWWGRLEKVRMATESGGDKTATRPGTRPAVPGMRPATRRRRRLVTNETTATVGVRYSEEGEL